MNRIFETVKKRLEASFALSHFEIDDFANEHQHHKQFSGGAHLKATIVSQAFEGLDLIDRHRKVYELVNDLMQNEIHALSMKTYTPNEWISVQEKQ
ncbi:MAG: BolA family transcriptional regulator [Candidatus Marinimicrobia bacterium]|nr:BolA family transcriptional regulator [Candidatus Neomarinimicrobiota bacterium]